MTKPTKTIPLDQYGLPARELELPEELFAELDQSWDAFVEQRAVELAQQAHPEPVKPSASRWAPPDDEQPDRTMTIVKWWKKWQAAGTGYDTVWVATIWTIGMSLLSTGLIAGVFLDFDEFAEDTPFWASLFLLLNPLWWSFLVDAFKKKGRWWITLPLLAVVVGMLRVYGAECDLSHSYRSATPYGHSNGYHLEGERLWYFASAFLLFLPTRLAWFWKRNHYKAKLRKAKEKAVRIEEEWKTAIDTHAQAQAAELARQRGEIAVDPAQLLAFLQESELILWKKPKDAWVARLQEIVQGIAKGRAYLATVREHEADGDPLSIDEEFVRSHIQTLEDERRQIIKLQDQVEGSQEAFKHVAKRVGVKLDKRKAEEEILAWARKTTADHNTSAILHERSRVVLQASVVWWQRLLRHQDAALEAARELRELDAPIQFTDEQHCEAADLEVARAILDQEPEV